MASFQELFPGALSLTLPLPFELESVNVFLIALDDGYMLVDCGMRTDASFETLNRAMAERGVEWREVRQVLLTHMHPDHMGQSAQLLELSGAELSMHEVEARHLQMVVDGGGRIPWLDEAYASSGVPAELEEKMERHFLDIRKNFHELKPARLFSGGEKIETAIGPLRVVWTSGHSPGHICLYQAERRVLFSGDQILEKITPNIAWHPERDMLAEFLESLERLAVLQVDLIVPSHGTPFRGHRVWIEQTIGHHRERCHEILGLVEQEPRTAHSLVGDLWRRKLSPINHHFAVFEVMAHLEYMRRQGRVESREEDGALAWRA